MKNILPQLSNAIAIAHDTVYILKLLQFALESIRHKYLETTQGMRATGNTGIHTNEAQTKLKTFRDPRDALVEFESLRSTVWVVVLAFLFVVSCHPSSHCYRVSTIRKFAHRNILFNSLSAVLHLKWQEICRNSMSTRTEKGEKEIACYMRAFVCVGGCSIQLRISKQVFP